jgi:hypothetical protein
MNLQLANVLSDLSGVTEPAIIKAILAGERDPHKLAAFRNWRVQATQEQIERTGKGRLPTNNRITNALKMPASSLPTSNTYVGAQFRRLRTKLGAPVAIKAMAAKLARLLYRMLRHGMQYVDRGAKFYETQHRNLQIAHLKRKAAKLGFRITELAA